MTLVAGGAGLLGSAVARRLATGRDAVLVADYFGESGGGRAVKEARARALGELGNVTVVRADLSSPMMGNALLGRRRPSTVVNAALFDPRGPGLAPLVEACLSSGVAFFLHLSDAALFPDPPGPEAPTQGEEPPVADGDGYLARRLAEEALLQVSGLPHAIVRVVSLAGPERPKRRLPTGEREACPRGEELLFSYEDPGRFLRVDDAARGVLAALARGPSREIVRVGVEVAGCPDTGTAVPRRAPPTGRSAVSRRELFGLFRRASGRGGPAG